MSLDSTIALCTLEDVKRYMTVTDALNDDIMTDLINAVSADCQNRYLERTILKTADEHVELYDGDDTNILFLRNYPIISVDSLVLYEGASSLTDTDYVIYEAEGKIALKYDIFKRTINEIEVTYHAGYDGVANVPKDLRQSVIEAVAHQFVIFDKKRLGMTSQTLGEQTQAYTQDDYPPRVIHVWENYKRPTYS